MGILTMTRENTRSGERRAAKVAFEVLFPIMTVNVICQNSLVHLQGKPKEITYSSGCDSP
jgi:hypothetical protein